MTALLTFKQTIREFYGKHDTWILPLLKFLLAITLFKGINSILGYMEILDSIFVVLSLSLLCSVLPVNAMTIIGCGLIIGHCYAAGIEVAAFAIVLIILLMIMFLRFTSKDNLALVMAPVGFTFHVPAAVPIGCGLLREPSSAVPAGCGIVLYYFMCLVRDKAGVLQGKETEPLQKLQILLDGLVKNHEMWLVIITFAVVILVVYVIRQSSFDYSWRVAVVAGTVIYIVFLLLGSMFFSVSIKTSGVLISGILSALIGFLIEFAVLGVDYSRTEVTQFEDDEYVYYVKAVPKSFVPQKQKSVKTFATNKNKTEKDQTPEKKDPSFDFSEDSDEEVFDFGKQLEESLKDL